MTSETKHRMRSHRSHGMPVFKSRDKASHEYFGGIIPRFKFHRKRYDGRGRKITDMEGEHDA